MRSTTVSQLQEIQEPTVRQIRTAAVRLFCAYGYAGTSIDRISHEADVSVSTIQRYFGSKQGLLFELISSVHDGAIAQVEAAIAGVPADGHVAKLESAVWALCDYHMRFRAESFIGNTELRSLEPEGLKRIVAKRDHQSQLMRGILVDGSDAGAFHLGDPRPIARALLMMIASISTWYDPSGPQAPRQIVQDYCAMALRITGAGEATGGSTSSTPVRDR